MEIIRIDYEDNDIRLDRWFQRHLPHVSQGELQKALRKKLVKLDGKKAEASSRVASGQELKVAPFLLEQKHDTRPRKKFRLTPEMIEETRSWVLYEDRDVIAINKPSGLATQGGSGLNDHLDGRLAALQGDYPTSPKLVHRLDKDTSGVLVLGRTAQAAAKLSDAFRHRDCRKTYWALVVGVPNPRDGELESKMEKQARAAGKEVMQISEDGKKAITQYRTIDFMHHKVSWMELRPITGRTHQLRVHMAQLDCAIVGDAKYGGMESFVEGLELEDQLHLHARHLELPGLPRITANMPPHMKRSFKACGFMEAEGK